MTTMTLERANEIAQARIEKLEATIDELTQERDYLANITAKQINLVLQQERTRLKAENQRQAEVIREAYEVWAGSEGFIPKTAREAYQRQIIEHMVEILGKALQAGEE